MRIQHNITAMNAYRNYNTNTKALAKNLEKLSSGYRINRAGDDAAGLAISEKMRAQITGLEVAQKNAKDGISLVQTAEGAMTEVHDMLNRMYELAEQSSNGTYQNEVDREQMQKEITSLSEEINRIADSTNFNGIKLLDGSMKESGFSTSDLPSVGDKLGTNTVLHGAATAAGATTTSFSVDLHNVQFSNNDGESFTLSIGGQTFKYTAAATGMTTAAGNAMDAAKIAAAFAGGEFKNADDSTMTAGSAEINGGTFTVTANGNRLTFTQAGGDSITGDMAVEVKGSGTAATTEATIDTSAGTCAYGAVFTDGNGSTKAKNVLEFANLKFKDAGTVTVAIAGKSVEVAVTAGMTDSQFATAFADAYNAGTKINDTNSGDITATAGGTTVTLEGTSNGVMADKTKLDANTFSVTPKSAQPAGDDPISGDYNVSTTVVENKGEAAAPERLASTYFNLAKNMVKDGQALTIGKESYVFKTDKNSTVTADAAKGQKLVDVSDLDVNDANYLSDVATKLTKVAENNSTYTVGHDDDKNGKVTITEKADQTDFVDAVTGKSSLTSLEAIAASLKFGSASGGGKEGAKGLVLQIGDTSDSFNKMTVSINDMHTDAMGIGDIDVSTQEGASAAMKKIQAAINYVSDTRGDLGSLQNRLDHTISNLSVMQENIQDAEATIRDVDVAEEMMAYTKNNILVQSAQAMLAQANQLPQGVLQLLQ